MGAPTFAEEAAFLSHLEIVHTSDVRYADLASVAKYSTLDSSCIECMICGSEQGLGGYMDEALPVESAIRQRNLQECMANHLEALALSSLPWHFGTSQNTSSSHASGTNTPRSISDTDAPRSSTSASPKDETTNVAGMASIAVNAETEAKDIHDVISAWSYGAGSVSNSETEEIPFPQTDVLEQTSNSEKSGESAPDQARALYDFLGDGPHQLRFLKDDIIHILDHSGTTWWEGEFQGSVGRFPPVAIKPLHFAEVKPTSDPLPLLRAAERGEGAVVRLLMDIGLINVNAKDKTYGQTPLLRAARGGHAAVVAMLLTNPATDVDLAEHTGRTPLLLAARNGHLDVVRLLLGKGASVDSTEKSSQTPLSQAAEKGHIDVIKELLSTGRADPNAKEMPQGWTPLWWAAHNGHADAVKLLLDEGAEVDVADEGSGQAPLSIAAANGDLAIVTMLLARGADPTLKDRQYGLDPLEWAKEKGHSEVVRYLQLDQTIR